MSGLSENANLEPMLIPGLDVDHLQRKIPAIEASIPEARLGVAIRDVRSGQTFLYRGSERFPMQSVFKLPLGSAVLKAVDRGAVRLNETIHVRAEDLSVPYSDVAVGRRYSVERLLRMAVGLSDNTAADLLMRRLGGPTKVNALVGSPGLRIDRYERDLQRDATGVGAWRPALRTEAGFVAELRKTPLARQRVSFHRWLRDPRDTATPRGMMKFLEGFRAGSGLKPASQRLLWSIALASPTGPNRLRAGLPKGTPLAHKTGTGRAIDGRAGAVNDVGVATLPGGRQVIIVALLAGARGTSAQRERAIADVARAAVEAVR